MFSHREDKIIVHLKNQRYSKPAVLRKKLFQLRKKDTGSYYSVCTGANNPVSANHNLKIFPVIQLARPQLHEVEKIRYKWPEPLENCGNTASGCKALSCGKNILQLSINTVPCWQLVLIHSGFHQKGLHIGCSKLWMLIEHIFFLIIPIYQFLPLLSYLMHQTLKRIRTQKHGSNECTGTGYHMAQRHHHWVLHVIRDIAGLAYVGRCWRNALKQFFHIILYPKQHSNTSFSQYILKTSSEWVEISDCLNIRAAKFYKNLQNSSLCTVLHSPLPLPVCSLQGSNSASPPVTTAPFLPHRPICNELPLPRSLLHLCALIFISTHCFWMRMSQGLWAE